MTDHHAASSFQDGYDTGETSSPPTVVEMALSVAAEGWPVFPCKADKSPIHKGGFKNASTDPAVIRGVFRHPQAQLIGVPTGPRSGIDVLDLDPRHGSEAWKQANQHLLPETRVHQTPGLPKKPGDPVRPGEHYLFRHAPGVVNDQSGRIGAGVDIRGEGGYVIVPPSPGYRVISDADIADWPRKLLGRVCKRLHPEQDYADLDHGEIVLATFFVPGGDAPSLLEAVDQPLDLVA